MISFAFFSSLLGAVSMLLMIVSSNWNFRRSKMDILENKYEHNKVTIMGTKPSKNLLDHLRAMIFPSNH